MTPLMLGTPVFSRATSFVARKRGDSPWFIPERGNFEGGPQDMALFEHVVEIGEKTNKSVMRVAASRTGLVIGMERKHIGISHSSSRSYSGGLDGWDDFDPGYLQQQGYVDLYVVRSELKGTPWYAMPEDVSPLPPPEFS